MDKQATTLSQFQDSSNKQATTLSKLLRIVVAINLKFEHMTPRIEELGNGDSASINRSGIGYHSHGRNSFQTRFSKLNFPNSELRILVGRFKNKTDFLKLMELETKRR